MSVESTSSRPRFFKAVGILNIIFGGFLLLCGSGVLWFVGPFLAENSPFRLDPVQTGEILVEMRRQMIEDAKKEEANASDPASKEKARKARKDLEATPGNVDGKIDFAKVNTGLPWLSHYLWVELVSGPILNLLLVGSGLLLILKKGKKFAIVVLGLKIARLAALSALLGLIVVPGVRDSLSEFASTEIGKGILRHTIDARNAGGMPTVHIEPAEFVEIVTSLGYIYALMSLAFGAIYPVVALILITRPARTSGDLAQ